MAALVANYGSSSESESDEEGTQTADGAEKYSETTGVNLLTSANTESGDEDSESETKKPPVSLPKKKKLSSVDSKPINKLALPSFMTQNTFSAPSNTSDISTKSKSLSSSSVFANPFENAEQQKLSILEQHVKLSSAKKTEAEMGKKICWMYRKGRCRFGHKCKYAHDNDIGLKQAAEETDDGAINQSPTGDRQHFQHGQHGSNFQHGQSGTNFKQFGNNFQHGQFGSGNDFPGQDFEDEDEATEQRKRKKPGLARGMVPPKRSMSAFQRQAAQERPWSTKNNY